MNHVSRRIAGTMLGSSKSIDAGNGIASGHPELDRIDLRLLEALQRNARSTYAELGELVNLKPPAIHDRVKRLETKGFVRRYAAQLDAHRVGYELTAFVSAFCAPDLDYDGFTTAVEAFPELIEIHSVAGDEA